MAKERVLLKLTGNALAITPKKECSNHLEGSVNTGTTSSSISFIKHLAAQLYSLRKSHLFGIVIGGGNLFRGDQQGNTYGIAPTVGHQVGMLATVMNALILNDLFIQEGINSIVLTAQPMMGVGIAHTAHQESIREAVAQDRTIIFAGGVGTPFFTTDTTAVVRALQMGCRTVWKATSVDGVYSTDPARCPTATRYEHLTYQELLKQQLKIMDLAACALAMQHALTIRLFNLFESSSLIKAAHNSSFGSTISL